MPLKYALTLVDLLGDSFLELTVATETKALGTAFHFDEVARDRTRCQIEIEQGQIGSVQRHLVVHLFCVALHRAEQIDVRVERHNDLVAQSTLVLQEHPRQRHTHGFRPRRRT